MRELVEKGKGRNVFLVTFSKMRMAGKARLLFGAGWVFLVTWGQ